MNLDIQHKQSNETHEISLNGEIDAYTAPKLREVLFPITEKREQKIIIDLQQVNYMDSTGLGIFVGAMKATKKSGSTLKLSGATNRVRRLFEITGLTEVIDLDNEVKGEAR